MKWFIIPVIAASFVSLHASHIATHFKQEHQVSTQQTLNLTKEQTVKVKEIRFQLLKKFLMAHMGHTMTPELQKKATEQAAADLQKVLTPDQRKTLATQGGVETVLDLPTALMELFARVNITKDQEAKIKTIISDTHKAMKEAKEKGGDPAVQQLHDDAMKQIHEVLTADQIQQLHKILQGG